MHVRDKILKHYGIRVHYPNSFGLKTKGKLSEEDFMISKKYTLGRIWSRWLFIIIDIKILLCKLVLKVSNKKKILSLQVFKLCLEGKKSNMWPLFKVIPSNFPRLLTLLYLFLRSASKKGIEPKKNRYKISDKVRIFLIEREKKSLSRLL
jgi:hypothetical protein